MIALCDLATHAVRAIVDNTDGVDMDGLVAVVVPEALEATICAGIPPQFDGTALNVDLAKLRAMRRAEVNHRRSMAEFGGCATALGRVNTDDVSKLRISVAVQMALIAQGAGAPFSVDWTMEDNSVVAHDGPAMIGMGIAVGTHGAACHAHGSALKSAIDAASDAEAIMAIDIEAGWP